jgi:hypothetical protein
MLQTTGPSPLLWKFGAAYDDVPIAARSTPQRIDDRYAIIEFGLLLPHPQLHHKPAPPSRLVLARHIAAVALGDLAHQGQA